MEQTPGLPPELQAPAQDLVDSAAPAPVSGRGKALRSAGIVATGVVAGALGVAVLQGGGSSASTLTGATGPAAGQLGAPPGQPGTGQQGTGQQGQFGPPGGFPGQQGQAGQQQGFPGGGVDGETRVRGTVTAVSATSISLRAEDGTSTTVPVSDQTEVVVDGARATIAQVRTGDVAVVHVVPDGSGTVAERVLVGVPSGRGFGPPPGGQGQTAPSDTGTGAVSET